MPTLHHPSAILALALVALPAPAFAEDLPQRLSDEEMAAARGGFTVAGMEISLGAEMRTYLDGQLAMKTIVNWNDDGPTSDQWVSPYLQPATASALAGGLFSNGRLAMNVNDQPVFLANDGQTALLQRIDGRLQNLTFNTASGIDLRQEADISIAVSNYQAFQNAMAPSILMSGLADAISQSSIASMNR